MCLYECVSVNLFVYICVQIFIYTYMYASTLRIHLRSSTPDNLTLLDCVKFASSELLRWPQVLVWVLKMHQSLSCMQVRHSPDRVRQRCVISGCDQQQLMVPAASGELLPIWLLSTSRLNVCRKFCGDLVESLPRSFVIRWFHLYFIYSFILGTFDAKICKMYVSFTFTTIKIIFDQIFSYSLISCDFIYYSTFNAKCCEISVSFTFTTVKILLLIFILKVNWQTSILYKYNFIHIWTED